MKKDIDLLSGFNEAKGKKSSNNSSLIMVVGVLVIIGIMVFLFVSAKMDIKEKEGVIADLDNQLKKEELIAPTQQAIDRAKAEYQNIVTEMLLRLNEGVAVNSAPEISSQLFAVLFDDYITKYHDGIDGEFITTKVKIDNISVNGPSISLSCKTRNWVDAWDFVEYLSGDAIEPPTSNVPGGYIPTDEDKVNFAKQVEKNKVIFSGVQDNYPGLPTEGDGKEYNISFTLTFNILWEAFEV